MDIKELEKKWSELDSPPTSGYVSIRIDGRCIPDLFIGNNSESNRCLILEIPTSVEIKFKQLNKENLRAFYHKQEGCIILELLDEYFYELFNELTISLYNVLKDITDSKKSTENFILTINKWSAFLSGKKKDELSEFEIRGLIGELICLEAWIEESDNQVINELLKGWRGPFDETFDFEFDDKVIEVKAKAAKSSEVRISNEFQLDPLPSKSLDLFVVSLVSHPQGTNIRNIIDSLRQRILIKGGDITIFYSALSEKSLTPKTFSLYDEYKYRIPGFQVYDAEPASFPALRRSDLGDDARKLTYNLNLENCNDYLLRSEETNWK